MAWQVTFQNGFSTHALQCANHCCRSHRPRPRPRQRRRCPPPPQAAPPPQNQPQHQHQQMKHQQQNHNRNNRNNHNDQIIRSIVSALPLPSLASSLRSWDHRWVPCPHLPQSPCPCQTTIHLAQSKTTYLRISLRDERD